MPSQTADRLQPRLAPVVGRPGRADAVLRAVFEDLQVRLAANRSEFHRALPSGTLKVYEGFPHGMPTTHADVINADLLAFIRS